MSRPGVHGSPEIIETVLSVPTGSLEEWRARFKAHDVEAVTRESEGESRLEFEDPDGMRFAMIEAECPERGHGYAGNGVDPGHAITCVEGVVVNVPDLAETGAFLSDALGFRIAGTGDGWSRYHVGGGDAGQRVEIRQVQDDRATQMGAGTGHQVAGRVPDEDAQAEVAQRVRASGVQVTPVMDRQYFRSIYFRIPGGVIFEVATDGPGFDVDEPLETLGEALKLPQQYEARRSEIAAHLVPLDGAHA